MSGGNVVTETVLAKTLDSSQGDDAELVIVNFVFFQGSGKHFRISSYTYVSLFVSGRFLTNQRCFNVAIMRAKERFRISEKIEVRYWLNTYWIAKGLRVTHRLKNTNVDDAQDTLITTTK